MSTFCDVGGGFFFARPFPWCVGIRNGVEGGEAPPSKTTTEDDVIRCQLPPPCGILYSFSSSWPAPKDATFGTREWNDRQSQTIPRSAWEWRGRAKRIPFQVSGESSGTYRTTLQDYSQWLPLVGMRYVFSHRGCYRFFVSPYKPLSYTSLRGLVIYGRTTVVIESI